MDSSTPKEYDDGNSNRDVHDDACGQEADPLTQESTKRGKRKQTNASGSSSEKVAKKTLPTRSGVWANYTRIESNRDRCYCNYCLKEFTCPTSSGTTNLKNHMKSCKEFKAWEYGQDPTKNQKVINTEGQLQNAKVSEAVFREAANHMLVIGELLLSFVDSLSFKYFCNKVNLYKPHSRWTATKDIVKMYAEKKAALRHWFKTTKQRVSLTTDIWVSQVIGASYMVITAHFIDKHWRLKKLIIGFKYVTDHKGKTIATTLLDCLGEWGIEKVLCVTVDNASVNSNALNRFQTSFSLVSDEAVVMNGDYMHMRCAGHIINLIVKDGLADLDKSVTVVRYAISYVRSGTNRRDAFEQRVVGRITRGSLPQDVRTRWNSIFLMLKQAIKFKGGFDRMEAEDKLYNDHFLEIENEKKRIEPPYLVDWRGVQGMVKFLGILSGVSFYNS